MDLEKVSKDFKFTEFYELVHAVQIWMADRHFKVEVLRQYWNKGVAPYCVRYYEEVDVSLSPSSGKGKSARAWITTDFGWVNADTPELALRQGLGFIHEALRPK